MTIGKAYATLTADEAAALIPDGAMVAVGGFTPAGAPKAVPRALARRARQLHEAGAAFQVKLLSGASTGAACDDELARAEAVSWRAPYMTSAPLRELANTGKLEFVDMHLSHVAQAVMEGFLGPVDFAVVEATEVTRDGRVYLTTGIGNAPTFLHGAKKVIVELNDRKSFRGYLNPTRLGQLDPLDLLTKDGEHQELPLSRIRSIYFVRDFEEDFQPERRAFLSRPKLDGLWLRLRFLDGQSLEGVVPNDLLSLLDNGIQITPPDLNSNTDRIFVPRTALSEVTVLGVVGIARRKPAAAAAGQPTLFDEAE